MKKRFFVFAVVTAITFGMTVQAQSDNSYYLAQAWECLNSGNCDGAQRNYDVYKQMTGTRSSSIENAIFECSQSKKNSEKKSYSIGDEAKDFVGYEGYKIAYLDASGKHGFAVKLEGEGERPIGNSSPSFSECEILYRNRLSLGLSGEYWTKERVAAFGDWYTFDFSSGKRKARYCGTIYGKIRVQRF